MNVLRAVIMFISTASFMLTVPSSAEAHVKWFSDFSFADRPLAISEVLGPVFWGMLALSLVVVGLLTWLNKILGKSKMFSKVIDWIERYKQHSLSVMRAATAAVLLLSFQSGSLFVPELKVNAPAVGWISFFAALLLLFPRMVPVSGLTVMGLYVYGLTEFGLFHMLDYAIFLGAGYYLFVAAWKTPKVRETGLIALYSTVGFSLCWVAMEKLLYPQWSLYLLSENPQLTLGLNSDFFLTAAAFIEFGLGYLMVICLLQRPLAIVITLVFFSTTLIFGKLEVIGHTLIHAALIVFILEGAGKTYTPPINFHNRLRLKLPFAVINYVIVFAVLLFAYQNVAMSRYEQYVDKLEVESVETAGYEHPPQLELTAKNDPGGPGWNLKVDTDHFTFTPDASGRAHVDSEGHAHLYINGEKIGRVYGEWHFIPHLPEGKHEIRVSLNTNDHRQYMLNGEPIEDVITLNVKDAPEPMAHDTMDM